MLSVRSCVLMRVCDKVTEKVVPGDDRMEDDEIKELFDRFDEDSNGYLNSNDEHHPFFFCHFMCHNRSVLRHVICFLMCP